MQKLLELTTPDGKPLPIGVEVGTGIGLHVGCGYGVDPDWQHEQWKGRGVVSSLYDLADPEIVSRPPWGVSDFVARARCGEAEEWGWFEHASIGRHDSGLADLGSVAP
ncbi:hypothetical protein [Nocardia asteroides]|uniref:hypothetical protein n=1 Tax=Nocardia asteroides TaxID=1824 RepID=UPI001E4C5488|nr:hypothetical protein [Nocardia asteroides]UGT63619.1 hypothetical protein LTT61_10035 [Nocardia asteroides]